MMEFKEGRIPERRLSTLTAYIDDIELMQNGKNFAKVAVHELVKQSVYVHRIDLENMVVEYITSSEIKEFIKNEIREAISRYIQEEINEIFRRDK